MNRTVWDLHTYAVGSSERAARIAGDIALLISDWSIATHNEEGQPIQVAGTTSDVAQRNSEGYWQFIIDNPFGTLYSASAALQ